MIACWMIFGAHTHMNSSRAYLGPPAHIGSLYLGLSTYAHISESWITLLSTAHRTPHDNCCYFISDRTGRMRSYNSIFKTENGGHVFVECSLEREIEVGHWRFDSTLDPCWVVLVVTGHRTPHSNSCFAFWDRGRETCICWTDLLRQDWRHLIIAQIIFQGGGKLASWFGSSRPHEFGVIEFSIHSTHMVFF